VDESARRRIQDYVKPLAVGLDGITYSGDVERAVRAAEAIAQGRTDLDYDLVFLLAVFSGQERWVSRMGHRSRTEIFLASLSIPGPRVEALFRGVARLEQNPRIPEEEVVHDAVVLDRLGAYGIARSLVEGYRERLNFSETADAIEEAARAALTTARGRELAKPRLRTMMEFARRLREEVAEFGGE
jgi:hypothetical protein